MTHPESIEPNPPSQNLKGVLCVPCDHLNPPGSRLCEYCKADLWTVCGRCGAETQTALPACTRCGHRLDRRQGRLLRWKETLFGGRKPAAFRFVAIALLVLALYLILVELPKYL